MTSLTVSGRQLSEFNKRPKMPPLTALGRISVARRFAWANQLVCFLLNYLVGSKSVYVHPPVRPTRKHDDNDRSINHSFVERQFCDNELTNEQNCQQSRGGSRKLFARLAADPIQYILQSDWQSSSIISPVYLSKANFSNAQFVSLEIRSQHPTLTSIEQYW